MAQKLAIRFCSNKRQKKEDGPLETCGRERTKLSDGKTWKCPHCDASYFNNLPAGVVEAMRNPSPPVVTPTRTQVLLEQAQAER